MNTLYGLSGLAADYITEHGWTQRKMQSKTGKVCLTGALRACQLQPGDWHIAREVVHTGD